MKNDALAEGPAYFPLIDFSTMPHTQEYWFDFGEKHQYDEVSIHADWRGLNATDAHIIMILKHNPAAAWTKLIELSFDMDVATDSCILINTEFKSKHVGLYVNRGTCTAGVLNAWLISKAR